MNHNLQQPIHDSIIRLNSSILELVLPEDFVALEQDREHFIASMERLYAEFRSHGETELKAVAGACSEKSCGNCGTDGYAYIGPESGYFIRFLWDEEGIVEQCHRMDSVERQFPGLRELGFKFESQDEILYQYRPDLLAIIPVYSRAIEEIQCAQKAISLEEIISWLNRYSDTYHELFPPDSRAPICYPEKARKFYYIFEELSELYATIERFEKKLNDAYLDPMDTSTTAGRTSYLKKYTALFYDLPKRPDLTTVNREERYFTSSYLYPGKVATEGFEPLLKFLERYELKQGPVF